MQFECNLVVEIFENTPVERDGLLETRRELVIQVVLLHKDNAAVEQIAVSLGNFQLLVDTVWN